MRLRRVDRLLRLPSIPHHTYPNLIALGQITDLRYMGCKVPLLFHRSVQRSSRQKAIILLLPERLTGHRLVHRGRATPLVQMVKVLERGATVSTTQLISRSCSPLYALRSKTEGVSVRTMILPLPRLNVSSPRGYLLALRLHRLL